MAMLGFSQMATAFVSIVRNKILAVLLGPEGVGLFAQLAGFQSLASNAIPMGMQIGALKYFAASRATDRDSLPSYVATAGKAFFYLSAITAAGCLIFIKPLSGWALGNSRLFLYMVPPILGVPFVIQTQLWNTYLQAGLEMKTYSKVLLANSFCGLLVAVPLVFMWRQAGASVHLLTAAVIGFIIVRIAVSRSMGSELRAQIKKARFDFRIMRMLARFGGANIPGFALWLLVPFLVRTQVIHSLGLQANGIYQAVFAISSQYLSIPVNALNTYALAKISQNLHNVKEINAEVNRTLKVAFVVNVPALMSILLLSGIMVRILYSHRFLGAVVLFPWQIAGDYCKFIAFATGAPMVPQERFLARNVISIVVYSIYMAVFYIALPRIGLQGVVVANFACWFCCVIIQYLYLMRVNGYKFDRGNVRLLVTSAIGVCAVIATLQMHGLIWRLAGWGIMGLWMATAPTSDDRAKLMEVIRARLARSPDAARADDAVELEVSGPVGGAGNAPE